MRAVMAAKSTFLALALASCASTPEPPPQPPQPPKPPVAVQPPAPIFTLRAVPFAELPGWSFSDHAPALAAFRRSCTALVRRPDEQPLGRSAPYGGTVGEWRPVCAAAGAATDARTFFETHFTPHEVVAREDQMRRLTGYYEPVVQARRAPAPGFEEPFLARPADLVSIDLQAYDDQQNLAAGIAEDVTKGLPNDVPPELRPKVQEGVSDRLQRRFRTPIWGQLGKDMRILPYPKREGLNFANGALAFGRACDVYDVQVQGSARVRFEDGQDMRMAYDSQNGWRWSSIYPQLRAQGAGSANKRGVCAWMEGQSPEARRQALALDPSYVFFRLEPIGDPNAGPRGAQGVALTALGSMAVDPAAHPYGAALYVDGMGPGADGTAQPFQRLMIAQDTGGAIRRGPVRGDVFFGTGDGAGALAERMNAPARFWTLLPKSSGVPVARFAPEARDQPS